MSPGPPSRHPVVRTRRAVLIETLVEDATAILQSVVNEVAPTVVSAIDVDEIVERVDIQAVIERVDIMRILIRLDPAVLAAIVNGVVMQMDLNPVIERLDLDAIIAKVDLDKVLERVDVDRLMERTELGPIIASASAGVASEAVDAVRSAGVGLDSFVHRWTNRALRRGDLGALGPTSQ